MSHVEVNKVFKVYNGKSGCMCGCIGNYKLPSHTSIEAANKSVGYQAYDESDVNDRSVKIAVNKINKAIDNRSEDLLTDPNGQWISLDDGNRNTTIYFN